MYGCGCKDGAAPKADRAQGLLLFGLPAKQGRFWVKAGKPLAKKAWAVVRTVNGKGIYAMKDGEAKRWRIKDFAKERIFPQIKYWR